MPHDPTDRTDAEAGAATERHRSMMAETWNSGGQHPTCVLISHDYESHSIGIGVVIKVVPNVARVTLGLLDVDEAIAIRDELGNSIDHLILHRYRQSSGSDADD